jgi:hypothetical protein
MAARRQEYAYYVHCWDQHIGIVARDYQQAKAIVMRDFPAIKKLARKGAPLRIERGEAL